MELLLSNDTLRASVSTHGAELLGLENNRHCQYIWQGDPKFWGRHAPILFPIVGKVFNGKYAVNGTTYELPQHGFARDSEFEVVRTTSHDVLLRLRSNKQSLLRYPFPFELLAAYHLDHSTLHVKWTVCNNGNSPLFFQLGAHPAFNHPNFNPAASEYCLIVLKHKDQPVTHLTQRNLTPEGYMADQSTPLQLSDGQLHIAPHTFDNGALVFEEPQADEALLCTPDGSPLLSIAFNCDNLGIWSPVEAPFCCIEPWFGRADHAGFIGDISQRRYIQKLEPDAKFEFQYAITVF